MLGYIAITGNDQQQLGVLQIPLVILFIKIDPESPADLQHLRFIQNFPRRLKKIYHRGDHVRQLPGHLVVYQDPFISIRGTNRGSSTFPRRQALA